MNKYWFIWKWYSIKSFDKRFIYGFRRFNVNFVKTNIFLVSNRQTCVLWLRNKTYVPVFHRGNKIAHSWFNLYVPELVPIIYFGDKTWVHMFYFDSNMTVPLHCAAQVCWESVCWQDVVWLTVPWDLNK